MFAAVISRTVLVAALLAAGATAFAAETVTPSPSVASPAQTSFRSTVVQPTSMRQIKLPLAKSTIIDFDDDIHDILVSNPAVADAVVRSNRRLYLIGNKFGTTNVYVYGTNNRQISNLEIQVQPDVSALETLLHRLQPDSQIRIESDVQAVVLTGMVASPSDAQQAYDVATKFLGSSTGGTTGSTATGTTDIQVINGLRIRDKDQVMLRVTIAEVQRSAIKSLGIDLSVSAQTGNFSTALASTGAYPINGTPTAGSTNKFGFTAGTTSVSTTLRAFEQNGLLKVLSEPNLTAISGEEADFLVGGEFPITTVSTLGTTITYKKYGISLGFVPVVLSDGRISMKLTTEVSERASDNSITTRRASSTVEMPSGSMMVMAGLISDDVRQSMAGTPGIMNVPILGALFRSRDFQRTQTELAVFVQPVIVQPVAAGKLVRPDQNLGLATDAEGIFLGQLNKIYRAGDSPARGTYQGQYGFIYE
jgi:pilus assembly protein CpaC